MSGTVSGYELAEKLAAGDMGDVWLARELSSGRRVVVRLIPADLLGEGAAREAFLSEALKVSGLQHPGLVEIFEVGVKSDGRPYLAVEYVQGRTVEEQLDQEERLSEDVALRIADGAAAALEHAWTHAAVGHGHLKPDNIMTTPDGAVKVSDFGLARLVRLATEPGRRSSLSLHGTPHYLSPEQVVGGTDVDFRSDVYSLGAILYHILTGVRPFSHCTDAEAAQQQISGFLPDPQELAEGVSTGAAWLVEKMMIKDRSLRHASWADVRADLAAVRAGGNPGGAIPGAGWSTVRRSAARQMRMVPPTEAPVFGPKPDPAAAAAETGRAAKVKVSVPNEFGEKIAAQRERRERRARTRSWIALGAGVGLIAILVVILKTVILPWMDRLKEEQRRQLIADLPPRATIIRHGQPERAPEPEPVAIRTPEPFTAEPIRIEDEDVPPAGGDVTGVARRPGTGGTIGPSPSARHHPHFIDGAQKFNAALALYKRYQAERQSNLLAQVEALCEQAVQSFQRYLEAAPQDRAATNFVNQCYGLIRYARQTALMDGAGTADASRTVVPRSAVERTLGASPKLAAADGLHLAPTWNVGYRPGPITRDLRAILDARGKPAMDLRPDPSLLLMGQFAYLAPAADVAKAFGQTLPAPSDVTCPAFPDKSFRSYTLDGTFPEGFTRLVIVADSRDRLAALQLINDTPADETRIPKPFFSKKWSVYDVVGGRVKTEETQRIAHRVRTTDGFVIVDSELAAHDPDDRNGVGKSIIRMTLQLPQPVANLVLLRLSQGS
jgi:hypothetical protein